MTNNLSGTLYNTLFNFNSNKTLNQIVYPDSSTTTFTYDSMLRPKEATTQNGSVWSKITLKQDSIGNPREVQARLEDGTTQTTYYNYNSDISLQSIRQADGKYITFGYDKFMRPTSVTKTTGNSQTMSQSYTYDKVHQLTQTQLGSYANVTYGYNKDGQLRFARRNNNVYTVYTYASDGRMSSMAHKKDGATATTYSTATDALSNTADDLTITELTYTYNNDGEITNRSRTIYSPPGTLVRTVSMGVGYDHLGRMTSETYNGGGAYSVSRTYTYDRANNRTSMTQGGVTSSYTNTPGNRLQRVTTNGINTRFTYDNLGRMTTSWYDANGNSVADTNEERTYFRWTYSGLLKEVETWRNNGGSLQQKIVRYSYDESGTGLLRERTVVNGVKTRYSWEGFDLYLEEEWSGTVWNAKRAYANQPSALGSTIARYDLGANNSLDTSDSYWFYQYDEAGNVILITDKSGNVIKHFEQDAWGNDLNGSFTTTQNFQQHQTSKLYDDITGLYFFGARWYYPAIGRFISVSPIAPLSEEEYVYCGNNPVNFVDLDGRSAVAACGVVFQADLVVPDPTDLVLHKWIGYAIAATGAAVIDYLIVEKVTSSISPIDSSHDVQTYDELMDDFFISNVDDAITIGYSPINYDIYDFAKRLPKHVKRDPISPEQEKAKHDPKKQSKGKKGKDKHTKKRPGHPEKGDARRPY